MTEPRQDTPGDPQLSHLYREHAQDEPSAAIDQRILAAAQQAVATRPPSPRRAGWWQRWRLPLTLATTVMLTVSLALLVERQPKEIPGTPSREIPRPDNAAQSTAQPATPAQTPSPPALRERAQKPRANTAPPTGNGAADLAGAAPSPSPAAKAESLPAPAGASREAVSGGEMRGEMRAAPAASVAPPTAAPLAESLTKSRADGARTPARWLDEIRALRRAGKREEAERQLQEFRLAHPDYPLPEEFRQ